MYLKILEPRDVNNFKDASKSSKILKNKIQNFLNFGDGCLALPLSSVHGDDIELKTLYTSN